MNSNVPEGPLESKWTDYKSHMKLVNPANKRKYTIIVVGTGLAGGAAAASLGEMGYKVLNFCIQDSPRRAHSVAAQGGINAAKNYANDGDSVYRLFYDTIKGGDYRAREANVHRLAEVSVNIIDQCAAQGVPFAREYGGALTNRSFGGAQVSRTFYARGQTGQQLLLGAYSSLMRQVHEKTVTMYTRREMLELVMVDGKARGIVVRNLINGKLETYAGHAVLLCTGGYGTVFYLSTNAVNSNPTAAWRCHKQGALFANPCYTQIHPTCIPQEGDYQSKLTLMSESLRNDGRVWVPKEPGDKRKPNEIPDDQRDYFLERRYPAFGNLVPRDIASRAAKLECDNGKGVGLTGKAVYLDFRDAIKRLGKQTVKERYGNLFQMYEEITNEDPYKVPMRIYPASHYTMGGLWVDYNLMTNIPGLFALGEANFSDHGANRLGASALMQGLADGYFVIPYTLGNYLASSQPADNLTTEHEAFQAAVARVQEMTDKLLSIQGDTTPTEFWRALGKIVWNHVGMARNAAGLKQAIEEIKALRAEFWKKVKVDGKGDTLNKNLEFAGRVVDYLELAELMAIDALHREESCGGHFREEYQKDGEALRNDDKFCYVAGWKYTGDVSQPELHKEPLHFESIKLQQRDYK
ncbi:MAG: fumarate reductase/succinate dehydrogenase flavoprotein subunit [Candidatus Eremiobacteraeota bacterium]|nr:fumarate reductase/succinate dehydrogenase flavoprotein subunit [Candidatus Eremiobacteraeota bacterium]MCW5867619.1 fumarate reductase/succinate dehydrogenase flavoprotein subunit [Candidatus Eremiobacteraeota bacterium]